LRANSIDFAEIYVGVEMIAIVRIRTHFFNWVENTLVASAIEHQDMFFKSATPQIQADNIILVNDGEPSAGNTDEKMVLNLLPVQTEDICIDEDVTIVNPQNKLTCILC